MRQLVLSPRWIKWHVLTLGAMVTCGLLAAWQWQRAGSAFGSALNVGYGLQWPVFAVFFGVMWYRMLRMEAARLAAGAAPEAPAPRVAEPQRPARSRPLDGPSPFGPRPASYAAPAATADDDPDLAAYNELLAELAARDHGSRRPDARHPRN